MMTHGQAKAEIRGKIAEFSGLQKSQVQWPNKAFTVPATGLWARVTFQGGDGFIASLADTPLTRHTGTLTIQLFERKNADVFAVLALADQLAAHMAYFAFGSVELLAPSIVDVGLDGEFYQVNVNLPYRVN